MKVLNDVTWEVTAYSNAAAQRHESVPQVGETVLFGGKKQTVREIVAIAQSANRYRVYLELVPTIEPHQQRVIDEYKELTERRDKLSAFTFTPLFRSLEEAERKRLDEQLLHMNGYQRVLAARIHAMGLSHKIQTGS